MATMREAASSHLLITQGDHFSFIRSPRADQRYVSPRTPARLRDSASVDSSMPIFQHSAGSRGGSRFPGHVRYRSLHARARPFVTRFSRIGSNAIHEGWRVPAWSASRARYRLVRETCAACTYLSRQSLLFPWTFLTWRRMNSNDAFDTARDAVLDRGDARRSHARLRDTGTFARGVDLSSHVGTG